MEIRLAISGLILNYESLSGVPDKTGHWDEEMTPYDSVALTPRNDKCVLIFKAGVCRDLLLEVHCVSSTCSPGSVPRYRGFSFLSSDDNGRPNQQLELEMSE
jgi:hypothetical protein